MHPGDWWGLFIWSMWFSMTSVCFYIRLGMVVLFSWLISFSNNAIKNIWSYSELNTPSQEKLICSTSWRSINRLSALYTQLWFTGAIISPVVSLPKLWVWISVIVWLNSLFSNWPIILITPSMEHLYFRATSLTHPVSDAISVSIARCKPSLPKLVRYRGLVITGAWRSPARFCHSV